MAADSAVQTVVASGPGRDGGDRDHRGARSAQFRGTANLRRPELYQPGAIVKLRHAAGRGQIARVEDRLGARIWVRRYTALSETWGDRAGPASVDAVLDLAQAPRTVPPSSLDLTKLAEALLSTELVDALRAVAIKTNQLLDVLAPSFPTWLKVQIDAHIGPNTSLAAPQRAALLLGMKRVLHYRSLVIAMRSDADRLRRHGI